MRRLALVACVLLPVVAHAQSLGEIAQKERERRKKLQASGAAPVVDAEALKANKGNLANDPAATPAPGPSPKASGQPVAPAPLTKSAIPEIPHEKAVLPPATEDEWRERAREARQEVDAWQERYDYWSSLNLAPGDYFTDENGRKAVGSPERLQQIVSRAKAQLDGAKAAVAALEDSARRQNVPPGWLR